MIGSPDPVTMTGPGESKVVGTLLRAIVSGAEASTRELVRDIARDPAVWEPWREDAARRLRFLHFGRGGVDPPQVDSPEWEQYVAATRAALFDLAAGAPLPEHEWEGLGIVATRIWIPKLMPYRAPLKRDDAFEREYERVLRAAGRQAFWK